MCIAALAWKVFSGLPLIMAFNRDEFLARPTAKLHRWDDLPIIGGRDKKSGGTWAGINPESRRWAIVLNYREAGANKPSGPSHPISRGLLVTNFLRGSDSPMQYARSVDLMRHEGFNLVVGDLEQAVIVSNRGQAPEPLENGLHVFSNGEMRPQGQLPWPKCQRMRQRVYQEVLPLIQRDARIESWQDAALDVLSDTQTPPVDQLPNTGLPQSLEAVLSSIFIEPALMPVGQYGTRISSLVSMSDKRFDFISIDHGATANPKHHVAG